MLSIEILCHIFEFASSWIPVACLVERQEYNSFEVHEDPTRYEGGWRTIIVGRLRRWHTLCYSDFKHVMALPSTEFFFQRNKLAFCRIAPYIAHLCVATSEHGLNCFMSFPRSGSVHYGSDNPNTLAITWSPDTGCEIVITLSNLSKAMVHISRRMPNGFYAHFDELLTGDSTDEGGNKFANVTTMNNPDSLVLFRSAVVPCALKLCSRACCEASEQSIRPHVHALDTVTAEMIPSY